MHVLERSASASSRNYVSAQHAVIFHELFAHALQQLSAVQHARAHVDAQHGRRALHGLRLESQHAYLRARKRDVQCALPRAAMLLPPCCCPHDAVHMFAGRCVGQLPASQPTSMCIQSVSQLHLGSPLRKFGSVQFSSAIGYRLSVIGYRLSVISPHVVVRMPFDLDPVFLNT